MTTLRAATATDGGRVRSSNQDAALVGDGIVAVADGMGGHAGGEVAARTAVQVLEAAFGSERTVAGLVGAVRRANGAIHERSERQPELHGMGTTLTAVALVGERDGERLAVVNVGDSRAYLVGRDRLVQLTEDHSLVEEMVRRGELTPAEAAVHPHRHILTRAIGIEADVDVDSWRLEPRLGARLLLCSDGLTNECSDDEIEAILRHNADPGAAAQALVDRALAHGGSDNVTVVVADVVAGQTRGAGAAAAGADGTAPPPDRADRADRADGADRADRSPGAPDGQRLGTAGAGGALGVAGAAGAVTAAGMPPATAAVATVRAAKAPVTGHAARTARAPARDVGTPRRGRPAAPVVAAPAVRRRRREDRVVTVWSALFVLAFVGVLGGTAGFVEWYVRATYFLSFSGDHVAIFEGRPGGFLWFKPHVVEVTTLTRAQVFSPYVPMLEQDMVETSLSRARQVASRLGDANAFLALPSAPPASATSSATGTSGASTASTPSSSATSSTATSSTATSSSATSSSAASSSSSSVASPTTATATATATAPTTATATTVAGASGPISAAGTSGLAASGTSGIAAIGTSGAVAGGAPSTTAAAPKTTVAPSSTTSSLARSGAGGAG